MMEWGGITGGVCVKRVLSASSLEEEDGVVQAQHFFKLWDGKTKAEVLKKISVIFL